MSDSLDFFNRLKNIKAVSAVWEYVLILLKDECGVGDDLLMLFCIFFSMIDDGNICISLNPDELKAKWRRKLAGLDVTDDVTDYDAVIERGISAINDMADENPLVFKCKHPNAARANNLFVVHNGWLFTEKFFSAKQDIESAVRQIFNVAQPRGVAKSDYERLRNYYTTFPLDDKQIEAIVRAQHGENLIVTGGPGTGKTTIICYLMLELLAQGGFGGVYMAAPSGKAANRMKESITGALDELRGEVKSVRAAECEIISGVRPVTIHKLLGVAGDRAREKKNFPAGSVFIIDESSMIDVVLFAELLTTIAQCENARVFMLGDKDQLPSVQPGAIFSDLTKNQKSCLIELTTSQRFKAGTPIHKLKEAVRDPDNCPDTIGDWAQSVPDNWRAKLQEVAAESGADRHYPVTYFDLSDPGRIRDAVTAWYDAFYDDAEYNKVYSDLDLGSPDIIAVLDKIWARITMAKILCAENNGVCGTKGINDTVCEHIKRKYDRLAADNDKLFIGEQIIVTKNQSLYDLSNGDIGIVVSLDNKKHIMIRRAVDSDTADDNNADGKELIRHKGDYIFYPAYLLPNESIEPAYAITIHKSQGSEYNNILVFMPQSENSPLLNRQILYTAITRTKNATYIVSNEQNLRTAIQTSVARDTRLFA